MVLYNRVKLENEGAYTILSESGKGFKFEGGRGLKTVTFLYQLLKRKWLWKRQEILW